MADPMPALRPPLSVGELAELVGARSLDCVGPTTDLPLVAFRLEQADPALAELLRGLPCPVVGIGTGPLAPACDVVLEDENPLAGIWNKVARAPIAAMTLVQHLRASEHLGLSDGLWAESMAYATLQTGPEFRAWHASYEHQPLPHENTPPLLVTLTDGTLQLVMNRPLSLNAIGVEMRDALCEAFDLAALDPAITRVTLDSGARAFSTGGEVGEFGTIADPATAHWIRSLRLPARHLLPIADRLEVRIPGATIGAGLEIAAFARRVVARRNAWFQLPEINYGLLPGAGGTISVTRRIGRQRAAEMMLSARKVPAREALRIGLIDAIED